MNSREKIRAVGMLLVMIVIAAIGTRYLYTLVHPFAGIDMSMDDGRVIRDALELVDGQGQSVAGYGAEVRLSRNDDLLRQAQETYGLAAANWMARSDIPVYFREVRWTKKSAISLAYGGTDAQKEETAQRVVEAVLGEVQVRYDSRGRLLSYNSSLRDSTVHQLPQEDARRIADAFVRKYAPDMDGGDLTTGTEHRDGSSLDGSREQLFRWTSPRRIMGDTVIVSVSVHGASVVSFTSDIKIPKEYHGIRDAVLQDIAMVTVIAAVIVLLVVFGIKRYRAYEIGYRSGLLFGILVAVAVGYEQAFRLPSGIDLGIRLLSAIPALFVGAALWLTWNIGETIGRETEPERFAEYDLLFGGYALDARVSLALLRGLAFGAGLCTVVLATLAALDTAMPVGTAMVADNDMQLSFLFHDAPAALLARKLFTTLFGFITLQVFLLSLIQRWSGRPWIAIILGAVVYATANGNSTLTSPVIAGWVLDLIVGVALAFLFVRYGLVVSLTAALTFALVLNGSGFFLTGDGSHAIAGWSLLLFAMALAVACLVVVFAGRADMDVRALRPAFAQRITERQRLQRELEVARMVQMSFLPKENPSVPGLEIASRCAPAYEVGGDYYDFIRLAPGKLALAIGDVSGKGTQAAFYMTLAKGFLHALARHHDSPAAVLTEMNKLFYHNVDRGNFISMIYAVFDLDDRTVRIARAGHNPVIRLPQAQPAEMIHSKGLALGFERGDTFAATIEEFSQPLHTGDVFIFYTDGFPEAMSKTREEFGEQRMIDALQRHRGPDASSYLETLFNDTGLFTGKAEQHDDMTVVVVKILGMKE